MNSKTTKFCYQGKQMKGSYSSLPDMRDNVAWSKIIGEIFASKSIYNSVSFNQTDLSTLKNKMYQSVVSKCCHNMLSFVLTTLSKL